VRPDQVIDGRYRLVEELASGGNGVVWRAVDEKFDREVALKHALSPASERDSAKRVEMLLRESKLLARINHPNVITVFDTVFEDDVWWLVMEYAPGADLAAERPTPLSVAAIARYGAQLASGLAAVHAKNIVHRDIKPANIVITEDDRAKLTDFGISRVIHDEVTLATGGAFIVGTPGYMAPEVARGREHGPASDVFSLGATLFRVLEGMTPFGPTSNRGEVWRRTVEGDVSLPTQDTPLKPVLTELLRCVPEERPTAARARQLFDAIATGTGTATAILTSTTAIATPPTTTGNGTTDRTAATTIALPPPPPTRRRLLAAAGALVTVGLLAAAAWPLGLFGSADGTTQPNQQAQQQRKFSVLGEARTADPCALTDSAALARFGDAERDADYGGFNRCDTIVRSGDSEVDVKVELRGQTDEEPAEPVQTVGEVGIVREPLDGEDCERTLLLADGNRVEILASQNGAGQADLCAMADTATDSAVAKLAQGQEIPRRTTAFPDNSLINRNACALLDAAELSRVPRG
jgi:hypothetical protein